MAAVSGAAFAMLRNLLRGYGLEELSDWAYQRFVEGKSTDEIMIEIEDQPAFKRKYSAIFTRRDKGLPPVSIDEIVAYRRQALALENFYDLPAGMISDDVQVNAAIGGDVSFDELQNRVQIGADLAYRSPPEVLEWLRTEKGITEGNLIAFMIDPDHAMPFIERQALSARVAGAAQRQGFGRLSASEADQFAQVGVGADQAGQAFGELASSRELLAGLAGSGEDDFDRQEQLAYAQGLTPAVVDFEKRRRQRVAAGRGGGSFAGGLVSGTDR